MTTFSDTRWTAISQFGKVAVQLSSLAIFSRLLPPSDFGLLAMATIFTNLAFLLRDLGTSAALVQRTDLTNEFINTVFLGNVIFGFVLMVIIAGTSPLAALFFSDQRLTSVLITLSMVFPIASFGTAHLALMERDKRFKRIAFLEINSAIAGLIFAVGAAISGLGVFSLVIQTVATAAVSTLQLWRSSTYRPNLKWHQSEFRSVREFSFNLVGFNIINYFVRNIDNVLIGRFLGPTDLGFYNIAYRMLMFPIVTLTIAVNRALLPSYSKHQKDKKLLAKNYLESLSHISLVSGPIMAGLWAIREPLIDVFLGQRWLPVAQIFTWFAPTGYLQTMLSTTGTILIATGKTNLLRQVGLKNAVMITIGFIIGLRFGIIGMAIAFLLSTALASAITMKVVFDFLELRAMQFAGAVWRQTTLSVTMGLVVFFCNDMMADRFSSLSKLLILIPLGATIYSGLVLVFCSDLLNQLRRT